MAQKLIINKQSNIKALDNPNKETQLAQIHQTSTRTSRSDARTRLHKKFPKNPKALA
jgi:hypothetical protein